MKHAKTLSAISLLGAGLLSGCNSLFQPADATQIKHVIVIYAENRSFDNLYGLFPGANGIDNALKAGGYEQKDRDGTLLANLPPTWDSKGQADPTYSTEKLPNKPFQISGTPGAWTPDKATRDLVHRFYNNQMQIYGGLNTKFAAYSDAGGLSMGYYDGSSMAMWKLAQQYTLADNFFMGTFGGSYMNHIYLACACVSVNPNPPASNLSVLNPDGISLKLDPNGPASAMQGPPKYVADKAYTPDGYGVNTLQAPYQPSGNPSVAGGDPALADPANASTLPPQTQATIGDRLSDKGISWAWYGQGWNAALKDGLQAPDVKRSVIYTGDINFQPHHQPYNYFAKYAPGTQARADHLKDADDFLASLKSGTLPAVSFIKPQGSLNQHPGYTDVMKGDAYVADLIKQVQSSDAWKDTAIIVTYDENGGFWDHVAPPSGDRFGPGTRIPAIIVSPYAKKGFVDHTSYDTSSVLKFITERFGLTPLDGFKTRPHAGDLMNAFDWSQKP